VPRSGFRSPVTNNFDKTCLLGFLKRRQTQQSRIEGDTATRRSVKTWGKKFEGPPGWKTVAQKVDDGQNDIEGKTSAKSRSLALPRPAAANRR